jgi:hypothetical protein
LTHPAYIISVSESKTDSPSRDKIPITTDAERDKMHTGFSYQKLKEEEDKIEQHAGAHLVITYQMASDHRTSWPDVNVGKDLVVGPVRFKTLTYQRCPFFMKGSRDRLVHMW